MKKMLLSVSACALALFLVPSSVSAIRLNDDVVDIEKAQMLRSQQVQRSGLQMNSRARLQEKDYSYYRQRTDALRSSYKPWEGSRFNTGKVSLEDAYDARAKHTARPYYWYHGAAAEMKRAAHDNIGIGKPNVRASNPDLPLRQTSDRLPGADFNKRFLDRHSKVKQVQTMQERMDKYRRFLEELEDGLEDGGIEDGTEVNWNSYLRGMMQKMMKTMLFKEQQLEKLKK